MEQRDNDALSVGEVTVTVTPRLDWSGVAGELRAIAATLGRTPAPPEVVSDGDTDGATGYCRCGACGEPIDPWDPFCRHCGAGVQR